MWQIGHLSLSHENYIQQIICFQNRFRTFTKLRNVYNILLISKGLWNGRKLNMHLEHWALNYDLWQEDECWQSPVYYFKAYNTSEFVRMQRGSMMRVFSWGLALWDNNRTGPHVSGTAGTSGRAHVRPRRSHHCTVSLKLSSPETVSGSLTTGHTTTTTLKPSTLLCMLSGSHPFYQKLLWNPQLFIHCTTSRPLYLPDLEVAWMQSIYFSHAPTGAKNDWNNQ